MAFYSSMYPKIFKKRISKANFIYEYVIII